LPTQLPGLLPGPGSLQAALLEPFEEEAVAPEWLEPEAAVRLPEVVVREAAGAAEFELIEPLAGTVQRQLPLRFCPAERKTISQAQWLPEAGQYRLSITMGRPVFPGFLLLWPFHKVLMGGLR